MRISSATVCTNGCDDGPLMFRIDRIMRISSAIVRTNGCDDGHGEEQASGVRPLVHRAVRLPIPLAPAPVVPDRK